MTSALSLPASAGVAIWGAHKSLAIFCSRSSHTFPAFMMVELEMLGGLSQPKTFKISLWTCPKAGLSGFEPTDSVCFWKLPWQKVPAVDCSPLFKEMLAFVFFEFTSYSFQVLQFLDCGILWLTGLQSYFPWPSQYWKYWAHPRWGNHICLTRTD